MLNISNTRRFIEVCAVIITGAGKFILVDLLPYKFWFITIAIVFWSSYISFWAIKDPQILSYWGFQKQNFKKLLIKILPLALLVVLFFVVYGTLNDSLVISWHIFPVILLYPIWGTLQQFLMIGLVAINLHDNTLIAAPRILIVLLTSIFLA